MRISDWSSDVCSSDLRLADRLTTDRARDDRLHIGDVKPVPSGSSAVDVDIDIAPAGQPLGQRRANTRYGFGHRLAIMGDAAELGEIGARDLYPYRAFDAGREPVDATADRLHPDIGEARPLHSSNDFPHH